MISRLQDDPAHEHHVKVRTWSLNPAVLTNDHPRSHTKLTYRVRQDYAEDMEFSLKEDQASKDSRFWMDEMEGVGLSEWMWDDMVGISFLFNLRALRHLQRNLYDHSVNTPLNSLILRCCLRWHRCRTRDDQIHGTTCM